MSRATVRPVVWEYLTDRPGEEIHLNTMHIDLGLTRNQIQQGMLYLVDRGLVEPVIRGNSWRYLGLKIDQVDSPEEDLPVVKAVASQPIAAGALVQYVKTPGDLFEVVQCLKDGRLLLQDPDGVLYVAKKLET
jgi:hypothetical protein